MKYIDNEIYHVYNRGAHKQQIFFEDVNYQYCIQLLKKYLVNYKVSLLSFCLMPNHYHLVLRQERDGTISKYLQTVFNAYSQAMNKKYNHSGTLFEGRAKSVRIDSERYALSLARYIHLNPVSAGLTKLPEEWEYSDYRSWIYTPKNQMIKVELRDLYFNSGAEYKIFVQEYVEERERETLRKILGDEG